MTKKSERIAHIAYWQQSGQTKKAYCESSGIKYATFISWFREKGSSQEGQFVKLEKNSVLNGLEILLPNGIRIYSQDSLSLDLLKTLQNV